jgi:hypothetical protein
MQVLEVGLHEIMEQNMYDLDNLEDDWNIRLELVFLVVDGMDLMLDVFELCYKYPGVLF